MIPTTSKAKLPKYLSYPIGAQDLSEALAGAPHAEALTVWFGASDWPASEADRTLARRRPHRVLSAEFHPATYPGYDEQWSVAVLAVPRDLRHLANRLLREQGLPAVSRWLHSSRYAGWTSRYHRLDLRFLATEEPITAHETNGA